MGVLDDLDKKYNPFRAVGDAASGDQSGPKSVWVGEPVQTAPINPVNPGQAAEKEARDAGQDALEAARKRGGS